MSQPCIMVVEADVLIRSPLAEYLRECGYRVLEAASAAEARQLLEDGSLRIDIVLADLDSDEGSAFALAASIRQRYPDIEVMLASTIDRAAERAGDLCEEGPALSKPYDHRLVADQIRRLRAAREQRRDVE